MNGQSTRGGFYGFKIQSLMKYTEIMASKDSKFSLLHYMLDVIKKSSDPQVLTTNLFWLIVTDSCPVGPSFWA